MSQKTNQNSDVPNIKNNFNIRETLEEAKTIGEAAGEAPTSKTIWYSPTFFEVVKTEPWRRKNTPGNNGKPAAVGTPDDTAVTDYTQEENPLSHFVKTSKGEMVNTVTGEVIETKIPDTKSDALHSVLKGFRNVRRRLFTDICLSSPTEQKVSAVCLTLTMSRTTSFEEFKVVAKSYRDRVKHHYKGKNLKYFYFIERSFASCCIGYEIYHMHIFFWFDNSDFATSEEFVLSALGQWKDGLRFVDIIESESHLSRAVYYCTNYCGISKDANDKSAQKRATLKAFPAFSHIYGGSRSIVKKLNVSDGIPDGIDESFSDATLLSERSLYGKNIKLGTYITSDSKSKSQKKYINYPIDIIDEMIESLESKGAQNQ